MPYTVSEAYTRVLTEADKMGSDYFSLPQVLDVLQKEVYDFVEDQTKDIEKTQTVTEDIRPLLVVKEESLINSTLFQGDKMAAIPFDLFKPARLNVRYNDDTLSRETTLT